LESSKLKLQGRADFSYLVAGGGEESTPREGIFLPPSWEECKTQEEKKNLVCCRHREKRRETGVGEA